MYALKHLLHLVVRIAPEFASGAPCLQSVSVGGGTHTALTRTDHTRRVWSHTASINPFPPTQHSIYEPHTHRPQPPIVMSLSPRDKDTSHHLSGTIYHDISETVTLVVNNSLAIWRQFCLHGPIRQRRLWERLFKRRFINGLTYLLTFPPSGLGSHIMTSAGVSGYRM